MALTAARMGGGAVASGAANGPQRSTPARLPLARRRLSVVSGCGRSAQATGAGVPGARPSTQQRTGNGLANPSGQRGAAQDAESSRTFGQRRQRHWPSAAPRQPTSQGFGWAWKRADAQ
eukprot:9500452-Pyramimonas_sp.AAC.1